MNAVVVSVSLTVKESCYNIRFINLSGVVSADMCPKPNSTRNDPSKKSHVEELDGVPGLFMAIADDDGNNWSTFTFPVDFDAALYGAKSDKDYKYIMRKGLVMNIERGVKIKW